MTNSISEVVTNYRKACVTKCALTSGQAFGKSIMAGVMIGFGAAVSNVAAHNIANVGLARLAAAVVFPVGLMMVILMGAELFTGDCLMAMGVPEKDISFLDLVKMLITVYIGNFVGGAILAVLIAMSGQLNYSGGLLGAYTINLAINKVNLTPDRAIASGILCNILVSAAVLMAMCAKDVSGKLLVSFFVIMLFVTGGFEHCVANMYYITAGLIAKANPQYVELAMEHYGLTVDKIASLSLKNMLVSNLLPVTIGNIIGGSLVVGLPVYFLNRTKNVKVIAKEEPQDDKLRNDYVPGIAR